MDMSASTCHSSEILNERKHSVSRWNGIGSKRCLYALMYCARLHDLIFEYISWHQQLSRDAFLFRSQWTESDVNFIRLLYSPLKKSLSLYGMHGNMADSTLILLHPWFHSARLKKLWHRLSNGCSLSSCHKSVYHVIFLVFFFPNDGLIQIWKHNFDSWRIFLGSDMLSVFSVWMWLDSRPGPPSMSCSR